MIDLSSIDWNAVLNSNTGGLVISGIIGVLLASLVQVLRESQSERSQRKRTAILLGYEIAQTREILKVSTPRNKTLLDEYRKELEGNTISFIVLTDVDLFRTVYDKPTTNVSLLSPTLVAVISDVYRRVELINHIKRLANDTSSKGAGNLAVWWADASNSPAKEQALAARSQFIGFSDIYLKNLTNLLGRCDEAIDGLSKIAKIDQKKVYEVIMFSPDKPNTTPSGTPKDVGQSPVPSVGVTGDSNGQRNHRMNSILRLYKGYT
jgi:hypothetical protein